MTYDKHDCDLMCERLAAYIEGDLSPAERMGAERHLAECAMCAQTLAELRAISSEAAQLPLLTPSRDFWSGIESRIAAPVIALGSKSAPAARAPRRHWQFAIAAAALIAASAGTTYLLVAHQAPGTAPAPQIAAVTPPAPTHDSNAARAPERPSAPASIPAATGTFVDRRNVSATRVYDREITLLDSLVRTRRESLDPKTVKIIEQNLRIIDRAIAESREALAKDPRSPLLTNRLDNVLGSKVELLRTIAFLPSQS